MISENLKIEIRPIPDRNGIRDFSDNLEHFSQAHTVPPLVDPVTRKYVTGLSEEDIKSLKKKEFPYDLSDTYINGVAHPFWESRLVKVDLVSTPMFLYPGKSDIDFIKYKFLLANSYIYASEDEMKEGTKSEATHYIYNEEVANNIKATSVEKRNSLIIKLSKASLDRKRNLILIIENEITDNKNEDYLTVKFEDILKDSAKRVLLEDLLEQKAEEISLQALVKESIQKNVLRRTKQGIFYFENNLGFTEEDAKEFLSKDENQEILLTIKSKK